MVGRKNQHPMSVLAAARAARAEDFRWYHSIRRRQKADTA